jgi:hypothetical protein
VTPSAEKWTSHSPPQETRALPFFQRRWIVGNSLIFGKEIRGKAESNAVDNHDIEANITLVCTTNTWQHFICEAHANHQKRLQSG